MDIWGKDAHAASHLRTNNSETNWNSLKALMGEELFKEMQKYPVSWGYYAELYHDIYGKKLF